MISLDIALYGLYATVAVMVVAWLISIPLRDVSIVDVFWSVNLGCAGLAYAWAQPALGDRGRLVIALVLIWAVRLAGHILWRNWGEPEDRRYRAMREKREPGFWWKSLGIVFLLQAAIAWVISLPILGGVGSTTALFWLDGLGLIVWMIGLGFESLADFQLGRFLSQPERGAAVMDRGLWRYSRHPNYFGEFCLWWGIYLIALAAGAWWTIVGPVLLTFFLLKVSGVALTEADIAERRPEYRQYVRRTSAFFPRPPTED